MVETLRWSHPYVFVSLVTGAIGAPLLTFFLLFRCARRRTCRWPRWLRLIAQAPGWMLAAMGAWVSVALAFTEIREKRVGLGTGMVVALVSTTLEALRNVRRKARRRKEV
ncbi:MAG TPA: hypothetical protein VGJ78_09865 [Vicinamibacterales bacterium]|jgi:hypothetical protein